MSNKDTVNSVRERVQKRNENVIAKRTILEGQVEKLRKNLTTIKPVLGAEITVDLDTLTAEHWFPSLYTTPFRVEAYEEESKKYQEEVLGVIQELQSKYVGLAEEVLND